MGLRDFKPSIIRKAALNMSTATYTPAGYWLSIPLSEFCLWIADYIELTKKD